MLVASSFTCVCVSVGGGGGGRQRRPHTLQLLVGEGLDLIHRSLFV